jgi:hypothetical protein
METHPMIRRQNIGLHTRVKMQEFLYQHFGDQLSCTWGAVLVENEPMNRLLTKLGFTLVQEAQTVVILNHLFFRRIWDLEPKTTRRIGTARLSFRIKVPDVFFSPGFRWIRRKTTPSLEVS